MTLLLQTLTGLDDEHKAFRSSFRAFLEGIPDREDLLECAGREGMLGMQVDEAWGGGGVDDPRFGAVAVTELARHGQFGRALSYAMHVGCVLPFLDQHASDEDRRAWLPGLVAGQTGTAVIATGVTASHTSDGLVLDGRTSGVVNGRAGVSVIVILDRQSEEGPYAALVDGTAQGVSITSERSRGLQGCPLGVVTLQSVHVPSSRVVRGRRVESLISDLMLWTALVGVEGAATVVDWTVTYAKERHIFGRALSTFPNTKVSLVRVSAQVSVIGRAVAELVDRRAAGRIDRPAAAMAMAAAVEAFDAAADRGMQLHGGYGYMSDYPISHAFVDARALLLLALQQYTTPDTIAAALGLGTTSAFTDPSTG